MSRVDLAPKSIIGVNMSLNGEEMSEDCSLPLWEDTVTCLNDKKSLHSPTERSLFDPSVIEGEGGNWLEDPDNGQISGEMSVRTQALIEGLEIDMSVKGVEIGVVTPTKGKGDHYYRHKNRLNRKSIDETQPDRQPKKSIDETLPDVVIAVQSPKAVSPAQSPHTVQSGRKGSFRRRRKNSNKHLNFVGGVDDLSDDSDTGSHCVPSSAFVKVSLEVQSPMATNVSPSATGGASISLVTSSPEMPSGASSADNPVPKTPGASVGSPYLFSNHQARMQQSPYFRALFGNMSIRMDESASTSEVPTPPTADDSVSNTRKTSTASSPVPGQQEHDPLRIELFTEDVLFVEGELDGIGGSSSCGGALSPVPTPEPLKRSSSYETSWPSLPKPSRSKSSSLVASMMGSPMSPPRSGGGSAGAHTPKMSPGSSGRLSGRKSTGKKSLSSDSLRWMRSDKYLSSLLSSGNKTPKDRRSVSSGTLRLSDSPRRMRFPEPDSILKSPIPFPLAAMELSDTIAVTTPTRYSQTLSPDRHTKLYPVSASTPEATSPLPAVSPQPTLAAQLQLNLLAIDVTKKAPVPSSDGSSSSSGGEGGVGVGGTAAGRGGLSIVDPFELSLKPSSPTVTHHHMSYARYLAMTATPKSLSRSSTGEELAAAAASASAEEESNDLIESCFTELDPQAVVRCLYNTFIAEDRNRSQSLGGFPIRSMTNTLNLASLSSQGNGGFGIAAMEQTRRKSWDDPDTESDEEDEDTDGETGVRSALLSSAPAEAFQEHVRSFGMSCNVPMFESTLRRCSYFKTLPQERIPSVDFMWMFQQIYPTHYVLRKGRELSLDHLTGEKVLTSYLSRSYVFSLVSALSHEDDRVTSSRLSVLKMFYLRIPHAVRKAAEDSQAAPSLDDEKKHMRNASSEERCSMRKTIVVAMEHAAFHRLERCTDSARLSAECEIDNNYIAKRGYTADGVFASSATNCNAAHRDMALRLGCAIGATTKDSEERPAYKTRDNDNNMLELMKFVIACEIAAIESVLDDGDEGKTGTFSAETSMDLLLNLVRVFFNVFRCYGFKLGNSSEQLEQPDLLNSILECLEGLLLWSHLISIHQHWQRTRSKSIDDATFSEPFTNSLCLLMLSRVSKHWTRHCNFAQEIAFIRVTETLLSVYTPLMSMPEVVATSTQPLMPSTSLSLQIPSASSEGIPGKCLRKLLCSLTSPHFKVSLQAIQSLQSPTVLSKYILPAIRPDQFVSVSDEHMTHEDMSEVIKKKTGSSSNSDTSCSSSGTVTMKNVGLTVDDREAGLIVLVDRLRQNRTHWHQVVQQSSTLLMNLVYDRLQEIEDAQDCEMEEPCSDSYDPEDGNFL